MSLAPEPEPWHYALWLVLMTAVAWWARGAWH